MGLLGPYYKGSMKGLHRDDIGTTYYIGIKWGSCCRAFPLDIH